MNGIMSGTRENLRENRRQRIIDKEFHAGDNSGISRSRTASAA